MEGGREPEREGKEERKMEDGRFKKEKEEK